MPWLVTLLILAGFTLIVLSRLSHFAWSDDEAVFVLTARAVQQGNRLYDEVWFNYLPGFIQLLNVAFAVGGFSLSTARIAVIVCALLALLLIAGLSHNVGSSPWAGVLTILLLATIPHFLVLSGAAMTEVPAIGLATGAVWAALTYHRTKRHLWLAISGLILSAGLWVKPTTIPTIAVLFTAVWLTERTTQRRLTSALFVVALTVLPLVTGLLFYNPMGFLRQFGLTYVRSKGAFELDLPKNAWSIARYFLKDKYQLSHVSLLLLGAYGWRTLRHRKPTEALLLGVWFVSVSALLFLHTPLYHHHLIQLLLPVAVLAGLGLERVFSTLRACRQPVKRRVKPLVLHGILLVITVVELTLGLKVDTTTLPRFESDNAEMGETAAQYIRETIRPNEVVITDAHIIALAADRPVPVELTNTSRMRIRTGQLTDQQLIDIARRVQPGAIVFWENKLDSLDDFATWTGCRYDLTAYYGERHRIYQPRPYPTSGDISVPLDVSFGQEIHLLGYSVAHQPAAAGNAVELTLYWRAKAHPQDNFRVFVHLVNQQGVIVGQDDGIPQGGQCPTWIWQPGEVIADLHTVDIDRDGAEGPYRLVVGLYDADGRRLPSFDSQDNPLPHDQVVLSLPTANGAHESDVLPVQYQQEAHLGDTVKLMGYDLTDDSIQGGGSLSLTLYWRCLNQMTTSYTVFTHLLNGQGDIVAQQDQIPEGGEFPTIGWLPGDVIVDQYQISVPEDLPKGIYQSTVGMYNVRTGTRLPASSPEGQPLSEDRVLLNTPIMVIPTSEDKQITGR